MKQRLDISILMPTYNRANTLEITLERMGSLAVDGLACELVVIDNNSSDGTAPLLADYAMSSPLGFRTLKQLKPGKNAALNLALDSVGLGEIVVFTDDDVQPDEDWLVQIKRSCEKHVEYSLFGGLTYPVWPTSPPTWVTDPTVTGWGFAINEDLGQEEGEFPKGRFPVGFNYWVRRSILQGGPRFDESLGPSPKKRILGDETRFQMDLAARGWKPYYVPSARVGHRISLEMISKRGILTRAWQFGRTTAYHRQLSHGMTLSAKAARALGLARNVGAYVASFAFPNDRQRIVRRIRAVRGISYNSEMLRAKARTRSGPS